MTAPKSPDTWPQSLKVGDAVLLRGMCGVAGAVVARLTEKAIHVNLNGLIMKYDRKTGKRLFNNIYWILEPSP